ncbi:MAG: serine/threonine-protein kinase, partial [Treponema succinifaciens]
TEGRANYIVLEFVDGMSLDKLIEKQVSLPPELALLIFLDACLGLKNAHSKDIVHRDIKPGNILISKRAEVKLADFGIASDEKDEFEEPKKTVDSDKTVVSTKNSSITQAGSTLGTPAYMSPEQLMDSSSVDVRADIYSMGVMLYEMVTGSKPYAGDMSPETIAKIKKGKYIPPQKIVKNLPPVVKTLIRKMMKPEPEKRYKSLEPVIAKVRRYLKNYDTHAIRVSLAQSIISTKTIKFPLYIPKNYKAKRIALGACAVCAVALLFCEAWNSGMIHRTVLRNWFTPVSLSMLMPSTASVNADLPARAFFFVNDNDGIPEVPNTRRVFSVAKNSSKGKNLEYITKDVFLRPGEYRIKIAEGPYVWWKSISVGKEKVIMNLDFLKNASRNITVHFSAMDCETGKDLTQSSLFRIQVGSKWVDASKVDFSKLKTGNVYKFLMIHEGYYDEYFSLLIDWYQDELFITGNMRKK